MSTTHERFLEHAQSINDYAELRLSESDTRAYLVDPLLRILGYEGVKHLRREVPVPATKEFIDYALLIDGDLRALVEAKALRHSLSDQHIAQCVQYASILGVRWCLITNGDTWVVYDSHAKGPLSDKRVAEVRLGTDPLEVERAWEVLSMFSRESLGASSPLSALLIDRVVADELAGPDSGAVNALRKALRDRFGERASGDAVVAAVNRLLRSSGSVSRDREVAAPRPAPTIDDAKPVVIKAVQSIPARSRRTGPRVSLADLVHSGLLREGDTLEALVHGVTHVARIRDGSMEVSGIQYTSPSAASKTVRQTVSWNGWIDWRHSGETLAEIRERFLLAAGEESTSRVEA